jgi:predicted DNA binding CopG/RHH family protein
MNTCELDQEEQEILQDFESGAYISTLTLERKQQLAYMAEQTFKQDSSIEITMSSRDLANIQRRALMAGITYQALISSILHRYASGSLYEVVTKPGV